MKFKRRDPRLVRKQCQKCGVVHETCPIPSAEALHIYNPDTGIVFFIGHFQLSSESIQTAPPLP